MDTVLLATQLVLAAVFATAAAGKFFDLAGSRQALIDFGVPLRAAKAGGVLLPVLELAAALALLTVPTARWGALLAFLLLLVFIGGIANALAQGRKPDCHCFGQLHSAPAGNGALVRNGILAVLAAVVVVGGAGTALDDWFAARTTAEIAAVVAGIAAVVLGALVLKFRHDLRLALRQLADAQFEVASIPPGLPMGVRAPTFVLPDLDGQGRSLESLCGRGLPVLLVFGGPGCGACKDLFPLVGRWQVALADRLTIAVISNGSPEDNVPLTSEYGLQNVLLQLEWELMEAYRLQATPTAVLVDTDGTIASTPALGSATIEPLVRLSLGDERVPVVTAPSDA